MFISSMTGLNDLPYWMTLVFGFLLGSIAGSYLATILWRWPRGDSANRGRSCCDSCGRQLGWQELIPIVSVMLAKGRCRTCNGMIDPQHSIIELLCGALGALCFVSGNPWLAPLAWVLVLLAYFDFQHLWLPTPLVAAGAIIAIAVPAFEYQSIGYRIAGGAIGFGVLWLVAAGYRWLRNRDGLGGGDAKLFGAIGLWVGPLNLPLILLISCVIGLADVAMRMAAGRSAQELKLPLGTYMAVTAIGFIIIYPFRTVFGFSI